MFQEFVGQYLDREVYITTDSDLYAKLAPGLLARVSVLFWIATERHLDKFRSHLRDIVAGAPLVVFVGGRQADKAFDDLLGFLANDDPGPQIMTRSREGTLPECIEELLQGTWPSEDRFDDWTTYAVVAEDVELTGVREATIDALGAHLAELGKDAQ